MLNPKPLFSDPQLRQQIKEANSPAEAIALIKTAGVTKGYQCSRESLSQLVSSQLEPLSEADLFEIAAGARGDYHPGDDRDNHNETIVSVAQLNQEKTHD